MPAFSNFASASLFAAYTAYPFRTASFASKSGFVFATPARRMSSCNATASATRLPIVPYPLTAIFAGMEKEPRRTERWRAHKVCAVGRLFPPGPSYRRHDLLLLHEQRT